jgi:hypothetical protein
MRRGRRQLFFPIAEKQLTPDKQARFLQKQARFRESKPAFARVSPLLGIPQWQ